MKELKKGKSQKKLVLHKETLKTLKVKTDIKTGLPANPSNVPGNCGIVTKCQGGATCDVGDP